MPHALVADQRPIITIMAKQPLEDISPPRERAGHADGKALEFFLHDGTHAALGLQDLDLAIHRVGREPPNKQSIPDLLQGRSLLELDVGHGGAELAEDGRGVLDDARAQGQVEVLDNRRREDGFGAVLVEGRALEELDQGGNDGLRCGVEAGPPVVIRRNGRRSMRLPKGLEHRQTAGLGADGDVEQVPLDRAEVVDGVDDVLHERHAQQALVRLDKPDVVGARKNGVQATGDNGARRDVHAALVEGVQAEEQAVQGVDNSGRELQRGLGCGGEASVALSAEEHVEQALEPGAGAHAHQSVANDENQVGQVVVVVGIHLAEHHPARRVCRVVKKREQVAVEQPPHRCRVVLEAEVQAVDSLQRWGLITTFVVIGIASKSGHPTPL